MSPRNLSTLGLLTKRLMNVLNIATLNTPKATLKPLKQAFSHTNQSNILVYFCISFYTFPLVLTTLAASLEPRLCSRIVGPMELKALLGELDTLYFIIFL